MSLILGLKYVHGPSRGSFSRFIEVATIIAPIFILCERLIWNYIIQNYIIWKYINGFQDFNSNWKLCFSLENRVFPSPWSSTYSFKVVISILLVLVIPYYKGCHECISVDICFPQVSKTFPVYKKINNKPWLDECSTSVREPVQVFHSCPTAMPISYKCPCFLGCTTSIGLIIGISL